MKKTLLITLLSLAPLSAYADDASPFDMFLSVDAGYSHYSPSNSNIPTSNTNDSSYKTRATFAYTDPSQFGVQVDGVYSKNNIDTFDSSTADLAGHIFYRTEKYLVGGFAQYRNPKLSVSNNASSYLSDVFAPDQVFWGAEAQGYFDKFTVWYLKRIFEQKFYDIFHSIVETQSNNCKSQITKVQNICDKKCDRLLTEKNKSISEAQNKIASKLSIEIIEYILKNINVLLKKDIEKKLLLINTYIIDNSILNKILSSYFSHGYFYDDDSYDEPFSDYAIHLITPKLNNLIKSLQKV